MSAYFDPWRATAIAADVMLVSRATPVAVAQRQSSRLAVLLEAARRGSPLYRERLPHGGTASLDAVPPVGKGELMQRFDDWVCDPRLRLGALRDFVADPARIGEAFEGEFVVWESSGSSGEPALFVQDAKTMAVYDALEAWRRPSRWQRWLDPWYVGERVAFIGATDGHFASTVSIERLRRLHPGFAASLRGFSFLQPLATLVEQLNRDRPTIVATYPTAALLLAEEAAAGRLRIAPREIWTGGEALTAAMRRVVEREFGCPVSSSYGASEFLALASQCRLGALHLNSDWAILEPVDERLRPLPPGEPAWTTLLTNLANHVQPLIRYDLGDRVRVHAGRCACGSPLPVIEVQGRCDDMLVLQDPGGPRRAAGAAGADHRARGRRRRVRLPDRPARRRRGAAHGRRRAGARRAEARPRRAGRVPACAGAAARAHRGPLRAGTGVRAQRQGAAGGGAGRRLAVTLNVVADPLSQTDRTTLIVDS